MLSPREWQCNLIKSKSKKRAKSHQAFAANEHISDCKEARRNAKSIVLEAESEDANLGVRKAGGLRELAKR